MIHLNSFNCPLGITRRLSTRELSHHPATAGLFRNCSPSIVEPGLADLVVQFIHRIAPKMREMLVERSV